MEKYVVGIYTNEEDFKAENFNCLHTRRKADSKKDACLMVMKDFKAEQSWLIAWDEEEFKERNELFEKIGEMPKKANEESTVVPTLPNGWIACKEREPETWGTYHVMYSNGDIGRCYFGIYANGGFWEPGREYKIECSVHKKECRVVAWRKNPIPLTMEEIEKIL